ncbi:MAG: universal stress protein, partial [Planctomycetes bacterium]|nr:universal stress protein [Planctomycetota bacterium]
YVIDESFAPLIVRNMLFPLRDPERFEDEHLEKVQAMLEEETGKRLGEGEGVPCRAKPGHPVEEIVEHSADRDLIILGTHGRTGVKRALAGSVAERVVRSAHSSVLVLPL